MPSPLVSLPTELLESIVQQLPIEDARNLLLSCKTIYQKGKQAFDETCFRTIPVSVSEAGLCQAEDLLDNEYCRCLQTIFIILDAEELGPLQSRLASVVAKGLQASTKCDTIIIYDHPKRSWVISWIFLTNVAESIEYYLLPQDIKPFKIQLRNVRLDYLENLYFCGKFLGLVQSIDLRFDKRKPESYLVRDFERALSLASSLQELSLIVNSDNLLSSKIVRRITKSIRSKTFEKLTINGIFTSKRELQKILSPLKASIKVITLEAATFNDGSFVDFLGYIQDNFSLDYICFKDI